MIMGTRTLLRSNKPEPSPTFLQKPTSQIISGPSIYNKILQSFDFLNGPTFETQKSHVNKPHTQNSLSQRRPIEVIPVAFSPQDLQEANPVEMVGPNSIPLSSLCKAPYPKELSSIDPKEFPIEGCAEIASPA